MQLGTGEYLLLIYLEFWTPQFIIWRTPRNKSKSIFSGTPFSEGFCLSYISFDQYWENSRKDCC